MGRYNDVTSKVHIGGLLRIFGYLNYQMKHRIICEIRFFDNQGEYGIEINLLDIYTDPVD